MLVDSAQLLRARLFLATRFGVDSSELSESAVLWRVGGLLGVSRGLSPAASLVSIGHRLDSAEFPQTDEDLTDDELAELEARDTDLYWGHGRIDEWSEEDHPRSEDGRFTDAGGAGSAGPAETRAPRSWMRGFDDRDHQRVMDEHRRAETYHRAQSLKLKDQMAAVKEQAKAASPRQQVVLRRRFDKLSEQRETHRTAASDARKARAAVSRDLDQARSTHALELRAQAAAKRETKAARAAAEAQSFMVIGRAHGIGTRVPEDDHPVVPAVAPHHPTWHPTEADVHESLRDAERQRAAKSAELAHRDMVARIASSAEPQGVREERPRQVVSYAKKIETQEEESARKQRYAESDRRAEERVRAARTARDTPPRAAKTVEISHAGIHLPGAVDRAKVFLRSLLHRGRGALTPAAAQV